MHRIKIEIGYAQPLLANTANELVEAFRAVGQVSPRSLPSLAGPNDVIQLLLEPAHWVALSNLVHHALHAAPSMALNALAGAVVKRAWDRITKPPTKEIDPGTIEALKKSVEKLTEITNNPKRPQEIVTLAIPGSFRNYGMQVTGKTPEEVARQLVLFGSQAPEICHAYIRYEVDVDPDLQGLRRNPDLSIRVEFDEKGESFFRLTKGERWPSDGDECTVDELER